MTYSGNEGAGEARTTQKPMHQQGTSSRDFRDLEDLP